MTSLAFQGSSLAVQGLQIIEGEGGNLDDFLSSDFCVAELLSANGDFIH